MKPSSLLWKRKQLQTGHWNSNQSKIKYNLQSLGLTEDEGRDDGKSTMEYPNKNRGEANYREMDSTLISMREQWNCLNLEWYIALIHHIPMLCLSSKVVNPEEWLSSLTSSANWLVNTYWEEIDLGKVQKKLARVAVVNHVFWNTHILFGDLVGKR